MAQFQTHMGDDVAVFWFPSHFLMVIGGYISWSDQEFSTEREMHTAGDLVWIMYPWYEAKATVWLV